MKLEMKTLRKTVTDYCVSVGNNPMYIQGAGGNISWKEDNVLWIKGSGTWLSDARLKEIFVPVNLDALKNAIKVENFSVIPKVIGETILRPSIETLLHALMPHRVVVHVHAIVPLSYLVRENSSIEIIGKINSDMSYAIVNYHKPGEALAKAVASAIAEKPNTSIFLLQNHGVIIGGSDVSEVNDLLMQLVSILNTEYPLTIHEPLTPETLVLSDDLKYLPIDISELHNLALLPLYNRLKDDWALFPDHVVFLGPKAHCYDSVKLLKEDVKLGNAPELLFLKGVGVFTEPEFSVAKQAQLQCYYDVLIRQSESTRLRILNEQQVAELLNWDAEEYRREKNK